MILYGIVYNIYSLLAGVAAVHYHILTKYKSHKHCLSRELEPHRQTPQCGFYPDKSK